MSDPLDLESVKTFWGNRRRRPAKKAAPGSQGQSQSDTPRSTTSKSRKCNICAAVCANEEQLRNHERSKHSSQSQNATSGAQAQPTSVVSKPTTSTRATCNICSAVCANQDQLRNHERKKHPRQGQDAIARPEQRGKVKKTPAPGFRCFVCDTTFPTIKGLEEHYAAEHKPFKCNICTKTRSFRFQEGLEQHRLHVHQIRTMAPDLKPPEAEDFSDDSQSDYSDDTASESETEQLSDDGEDMRWPEHGEPATGLVRCLGRILGCREKFNLASDMVAHVEFNKCKWLDDEDIEEVFDKGIEQEGQRFYIDRLYYCYKCKEEDRDVAMYLFELVKHAESGNCDLKVRTGPLSVVSDALLQNVLDKHASKPSEPEYPGQETFRPGKRTYYSDNLIQNVGDKIYCSNNMKLAPEADCKRHIHNDHGRRVDDRDFHWPEHADLCYRNIAWEHDSFNYPYIVCLGVNLGCDKLFTKGSKMLRHVENDRCRHISPPDIDLLFVRGKMNKAGRRLLHRKAGNILRCPNCKDTKNGIGRFTEIRDLFEHAEGDDCNLAVRSGPLLDVFNGLQYYAICAPKERDPRTFSPTGREGFDSDDLDGDSSEFYDDDEYGGYVDSDEELRDYMMTGDISMSYLQRYGY